MNARGACSLGGALVAFACASCSDELPPLGEAVLVVDTDVPVSQLVDALRLDLYVAEGDGFRWYTSRSVALPDARDWPVSFSLFNPATDQERRALVRLRAYPRRKLRDYRGERFTVPFDEDLPFDAPLGEPPPALGEEPRLLIDGQDVTPREEPLPALAIDRLFELDLAEGKRGYLPLVLRGACIGTMADLFGRQSCVDREGERAPILRLGLEEGAPPPGSLVGSFGAPGDCGPPRPPGFSEGLPLYDEEVCVPGGAYVFGNAEHFGLGEASGVPERVAVISPFRMDRFEVTVGRYRHALALGFTSDGLTPLANDDELDIAGGPAQVCTFSETPRGRESYPLNCISPLVAEAFCAFFGGSLPSEAQWEHAAQAAGRERETRYPWGDSDPTCDRAVYARSTVFGSFGTSECIHLGAGPAALEASFSGDEADASLGLGIVALGGSLAEWMADAFASLDSACWLSAPLRDPSCRVSNPDRQSVRGGSWAVHAAAVFPGQRSAALVIPATLTGASNVGFRCVRPAEP